MALRRLSRGWQIASAICALIGLYALGTSMTWFVSMVEDPSLAGWTVLSIAALIGSLGFIAGVPLLRSWDAPPRWARIVLPALFGVMSIIAAVGMWVVIVLVVICADACRPVDTWKLLPTLICCGALCALGPGMAALMDRRGRGQLLWGIAVVFGVIGFLVGMYYWVEGQLF